MEWIKEITKHYGINPIQVDRVSDSLYYIKDNERKYALKHSKLNNDTVQNWLNVYRQADSLQLNCILPVYLTQDQSLYSKIDNQFYYLVPWIETSQANIETFYRRIGEIHAQTKHKVILPKKNKVNEFEKYDTYCQTLNHQLISYIETFEKKLFMSPFELQVCTHYHQIEILLGKLSKRIKQFIGLYRDETEWWVSLCHGNLSLSHFLGDQDAMLINFEKTYFDNGTSDLATFS